MAKAKSVKSFCLNPRPARPRFPGVGRICNEGLFKMTGTNHRYFQGVSFSSSSEYVYSDRNYRFNPSPWVRGLKLHQVFKQACFNKLKQIAEKHLMGTLLNHLPFMLFAEAVISFRYGMHREKVDLERHGIEDGLPSLETCLGAAVIIVEFSIFAIINLEYL